MIIGTRCSQHQLSMLARALANPNIGSGDRIELILRIVQDQDVRHEREEIHPDWQETFAAVEPTIADFPQHIRDAVTIVNKLFAAQSGRIGDINPSKQRICFLLGAGASKPAPSDIPTVKELLKYMLERARRLGRDDVARLADFCQRNHIENIEDLLTAAELAKFTSRNAAVLGLMNYLLYRGADDSDHRKQREADVASVAFLQDTLQVLFGLLSSTMLPAEPNAAHTAIAEYAKQHNGTYIVTTNYDCCMDLALKSAAVDISYHLQFCNTTVGAANPDATNLVKLHGSLNWFYCDTCQEAQHVDIAVMRNNYTSDSTPYPVIGICKGCGGPRRGLLVPPLAMKFDIAHSLSVLSGVATSAFSTADVIVVVGFSFADADLYLSKMLSKAMQLSPSRTVIIVDPDTKVHAKERRKLEATIPKFDNSRVILLRGDCAAELPKFLRGELLKPIHLATTADAAPPDVAMKIG